MKPSSFCSMSTESCWEELYGLLLSLSLHHTNEKVFLIVDTNTKNNIEKTTPKLKLDIKWSVLLDEYTGLDRNKMNAISPTMFTEFVLKKAVIMKTALDECEDTLFMDSDMLVLDEINNVDKTKTLGVSPHYINKQSCSSYGYFNAGFIWTNNKQVIDDWIKYTKFSRFHEQASIEDLARKYLYFEFGENYNFSWWRVFQSDDSPEQITNYLRISQDEIIKYKEKPLKVIHTHFKPSHTGKDSLVEIFNNLMISLMLKSKNKYYKHLITISKIINVNWILKIPQKIIDTDVNLYTNIFTNKDVVCIKDNSINEISVFDLISIINFNKLSEDSSGEKSWNTAAEKIFYG